MSSEATKEDEYDNAKTKKFVITPEQRAEIKAQFVILLCLLVFFGTFTYFAFNLMYDYLEKQLLH